MDYEKQVLAYCRRHGLIGRGTSIVAGVSGGADSVCLLLFLRGLREEYGISLHAVHIHHGIRREEADRDLAFTEALCRRLEVPFRAVRTDVPSLAEKEHLTLEEAGRQERYRILEEVRKELGADRIAVAHHMDDQAESILMNLLRGSGIRGAAGMRPSVGRLIRPLLCLRRAEIVSWLELCGQTWETDSTNLDLDYDRNRLRHTVMPLLEDYRGNAVPHLAAAAGDFAEAEDYLEQKAHEKFLRLQENWHGETGFPEAAARIAGLLELPCVKISSAALREEGHLMGIYLVREALLALHCPWKDITRKHLDAVWMLKDGEGSSRVNLPGKLVAWRERTGGRICLGRQGELPHPEFVLLQRTAEVPAGGLFRGLGRKPSETYGEKERTAGLRFSEARPDIRTLDLRTPDPGRPSLSSAAGGTGVEKGSALRNFLASLPYGPEEAGFRQEGNGVPSGCRTVQEDPAVPDAGDRREDAGENQIKKALLESCINWFDCDTIEQAVLRTRRPGDRIRVYADGRTKSLKELFIQEKVPEALRDRWPVVAAGDRILWVPGFRMDETCRVTADTRRVVEWRLAVRDNSGEPRD